MKKSWNTENWQKAMELSPEFDQVCAFFADSKKFTISLESAFSHLFCEMSSLPNLSREMVMDNQDTVMQKSWGKCQWEPCNGF